MVNWRQGEAVHAGQPLRISRAKGVRECPRIDLCSPGSPLQSWTVVAFLLVGVAGMLLCSYPITCGVWATPDTTGLLNPMTKVILVIRDCCGANCSNSSCISVHCENLEKS
jgi:hypothetical protein